MAETRSTITENPQGRGRRLNRVKGKHLIAQIRLSDTGTEKHLSWAGEMGDRTRPLGENRWAFQHRQVEDALRGDRVDRGPLGRVIRPDLGDHPHCMFAQFSWIGRLRCHELDPLKETSLHRTRGDSLSPAPTAPAAPRVRVGPRLSAPDGPYEAFGVGPGSLLRLSAVCRSGVRFPPPPWWDGVRRDTNPRAATLRWSGQVVHAISSTGPVSTAPAPPPSCASARTMDPARERPHRLDMSEILRQPQEIEDAPSMTPVAIGQPEANAWS